MSENIEKAVPTEESPKTKESETSAPAATDNVVLYPVADISASRKLQTLKRLLLRNLPTPRTQIIKQLSTAKLPTVKLPITQTTSVTPEIQKNFRKKMRKKTKTWKKTFTNNRKNPAPKMNIRSVSSSLISVPNARSR